MHIISSVGEGDAKDMVIKRDAKFWPLGAMVGKHRIDRRCWDDVQFWSSGSRHDGGMQRSGLFRTSQHACRRSRFREDEESFNYMLMKIISDILDARCLPYVYLFNANN